MRRFTFRGYLLLACISALTPSALAQQWGTLKGCFMVDGIVPAPAIPVGPGGLIVGPKGELANVVVYVRDKDVDVHPKYAATANDDVVLDYKNNGIDPHILVLRTTQTLVVKNSDVVVHNACILLLRNNPLNYIVEPDAQVKRPGPWIEELRPETISDNIHPLMNGFILVRGNPYFAVSKTDGTFEIKDLPAGKPLEFQLWQEKAGYLKGVTGAAGFAANAKGRVTKFSVNPGVTDLGDIKIPASLFAK